MKLKIPDYMSAIKPYVPGKPIDAVQREFGIKDSIKLASNENPLGPSPMAVEAIRQVVDDLHRYPDAGGFHLTRAIAEKFHLDPASIV
ncbi:MAG: histidinol-phosphate transaminase, partial [Deltaproteobacteria bacterium]|nr:histidinol-phosphate transaminase [Deltaproteobacteria bacterium]